MRRHRGFLYGLALMALSGFMANRADAGSIQLSVDLGGVVIFGPSLSSPPDISITLGTSDLITLNQDLIAAGSAYRITQLSADSNFSGGATGFLQINAQVAIGRNGTTTVPLSIDATQSGFLAPVGSNGTLENAVGGSNSQTAAGGALSYTGDFQGVLAPPVPITLDTTGSFKGNNGPLGIGSVPTGYSLSSHLIINMNNVALSTLGVTGTTTVSAQTVPEPASVVMLLTGLPMPLVFMGLLRRRKAKA